MAAAAFAPHRATQGHQLPTLWILHQDWAQVQHSFAITNTPSYTPQPLLVIPQPPPGEPGASEELHKPLEVLLLLSPQLWQGLTPAIPTETPAKRQFLEWPGRDCSRTLSPVGVCPGPTGTKGMPGCPCPQCPSMCTERHWRHWSPPMLGNAISSELFYQRERVADPVQSKAGSLLSAIHQEWVIDAIKGQFIPLHAALSASAFAPPARG